ncbi:MAG: hypothetical protein K2I27_03745, partial [Bacteroides sp.]|nr:hypothetical protein [Bacteroides sp.]
AVKKGVGECGGAAFPCLLFEKKNSAYKHRPLVGLVHTGHPNGLEQDYTLPRPLPLLPGM